MLCCRVSLGSVGLAHSGFIWYEKAESKFMATLAKLTSRRPKTRVQYPRRCNRAAGQGVPGKGPQEPGNAVVLQAITDHFRIVSANIRRVERRRLAAEPIHVEAFRHLPVGRTGGSLAAADAQRGSRRFTGPFATRMG